MITRKHMVRLADDYFRLHWEECEAAARAGMDTPLDVTINEHLGDAYWRAGRRYEARYAWRAAAIYADDHEAGRLRDKIADGLGEAS